MRNSLLAIVVIIVIVGVIWYLESQRISPLDINTQADIAFEDSSDKKTPLAKEIVSPAGFINSDPITIEQYIGEKVILVDFWTYSCINCQRTLPYLTAWWDKYKDDGLLMIGVHTPEFEFEKEYDNVFAATEKFGVDYPVVLDNDYGTWRAYSNRYWPRKYIIDIDGHIAYDHIGEGAYQETEEVIQELLEERMVKLGEKKKIASDIVDIEAETGLPIFLRRTPEIYFGSDRNSLFGNGMKRVKGTFNLAEAGEPMLDEFHLIGKWRIEPEFAENLDKGTKILLHFRAKDVFMVAGSEEPVNLSLRLNGQPIDEDRGEDVSVGGMVRIQDEGLYKLVQSESFGVHVLEITIHDEGLQAFTFTFG